MAINWAFETTDAECGTELWITDGVKYSFAAIAGATRVKVASGFADRHTKRELACRFHPDLRATAVESVERFSCISIAQKLWQICCIVAALFLMCLTASAQTVPRGTPVSLATLFPESADISQPYWYLAIRKPQDPSPFEITGGIEGTGIYNGQEYSFYYFENGGLRYPPISGGSLLIPVDYVGDSVLLPLVILQSRPCRPEPNGYFNCFGTNVIDGPREFTVSGPASGECKVGEISPVTDPEAKLYNDHAHITGGLVPLYSLFPPEVDPTLYGRVINFMFSVESTLPIITSIESGYRPIKYALHLHELRQKWIAVQAAIDGDTTGMQATLCAPLVAALNFELNDVHHIARVPPKTLSFSGGIPAINSPYNSLHSERPAALAMDISGIKDADQGKITTLAQQNGLHRPCTQTAERHHLTLPGAACKEIVTGGGQSPMDVLITDPNGRRVGYHAPSGQTFNEIGESAYYAGKGVKPQEVIIYAPITGTYKIDGFGNGTGPFTLYLSRLSESGEEIETVKTQGTTTAGAVSSIQLAKPGTVGIDIKPGGSPNSINITSGAGRIPVAILSTVGFAAYEQVEVKSLTFGRTGLEASLSKCNTAGEDVNNDGMLDMVCQFAVVSSRLAVEDVQGILRGKTKSGVPFQGVDWVNIVP